MFSEDSGLLCRSGIHHLKCYNNFHYHITLFLGMVEIQHPFSHNDTCSINEYCDFTEHALWLCTLADSLLNS